MAEIRELYPNKNQIETVVEIEETKEIIQGLLEEQRKDSLNEFFSSVNDLVSDFKDTVQDGLRIKALKEYYAIHFEVLDISSSNNAFRKTTIYIGHGIDLDMQREILGSWIKYDDENDYKFWLRVCKELKETGVDYIHIKSFNEFYWLDEAMSTVYGN